MTPHIGVLPLFHNETQNLWISHLYFDGIVAAGGLPYLLPLTDNVEDWEGFCTQFDGFLFTGGQDVEPSLYGEEALPECGYRVPRRDRQELWMLRRLLQLDKPVLGICRGVQMLNVAAGGTMYQDLPTQHPSGVMHNQIEKLPFDKTSHTVALQPGSRVFKAAGGAGISVNSMHHQAVKDVAPCFAVTATAPDGIVEAIEHTSAGCIFGVQWHPEFLWQEHSHAFNVFKTFTSAAGARP